VTEILDVLVNVCAVGVLIMMIAALLKGIRGEICDRRGKGGKQ